MGNRIRVTTEGMIQKKEEWEVLLKKEEKIFGEMEEGIKELEPIFAGKPVTMQKKRFMAQSEKGKAVLAGLREHVERLGDIALVYEKAERGNHDTITEN